jgi:molecular chaperone GrpE
LPRQPFSFIIRPHFSMSKQPSEPATSGAPAGPAGLTPEQVSELQAQAAKAAEHWDRLLRATADFDNYKKRAARERQDAIKYANEGLMQKLLPVLDNFEAALNAAQSTSGDNAQSLLTGISMIHQQLKSVLTEAGLEEIEAHGRPFDPNLHEAVSQAESSEHPEGNVMQQLRRGYRLRDRLLRPASVVVAKAPSPAHGQA